MLQAFKDAAVVAQDVAIIAGCFANVPAELKRVAVDGYAAAVNRSPLQVSKVITDVANMKATVVADDASAGPAFAILERDLNALLADLS